MHIRFSPIRHDSPLTLEKQGDVLILNGERLDLSVIPEGATLPQDAVDCAWIIADIERINGALHLALLLPHGAVAPQETLFPKSLTVPSDGPIAVPAYEIEAPMDQEEQA